MMFHIREEVGYFCFLSQVINFDPPRGYSAVTTYMLIGCGLNAHEGKQMKRFLLLESVNLSTSIIY